MTVSLSRDRVLVAVLALLGAYHLALTLSTVASYGLLHPYQDEFRLSYRYLSVPFPDSILALENAHRPVIPGLLRWFGLVHLGGSQMPQSAASAVSALVAVAVILREVARGMPGRTVSVAAAACLVASLLLWNANWRMFVHSNESAHVFVVTLWVVGAIVAALAAAETGRAPLWAAALACCVGATFSFGNGIAAFGAVATAALLRRARWPVFLAIAAAAAASVAAYMYGMPGSDGVRNTLGTSRFGASVLFSVMRLGAVFAEVGRPKAAVALAGGFVCVFLALAIVRRYIRGSSFTRLEVFSAALFAFGASTNVVIAVSRAAYFFVHPDQVFADRYLYWSALSWMAIGIYGLASVRRATSRAQLVGGLAVSIAAALAIHPAMKGNDFAGSTYERVETGALALRLDLPLDREIDAISDGGAQVARTLAEELRRRHIGDFAASEDPRIGACVAVEASSALPLHAVSPGGERSGNVIGLRVTLPRDIAAHTPRDFWVTNEAGCIVGALTRAGQSRFPRNALRLGLPRFDTLLGWAAADAGVPRWVVERTPEGRFRSIGELRT